MSSSERLSGTADGNQFGGAGYTESGALSGRRFVVQESSNMDGANADGAFVVPDGGTAEIVRWEDEGPLHLFALGANDATGTKYELVLDGEIVTRTVSPLGSINDPHSFVDVLGMPLQADESIVLRVRNKSGQEQTYAGRAYVGVMG